MDNPLKYRKSELSKAMKRNIKRKEKYLNRVCRSIWESTNPKGTKFLYATFCRDYDKLIVTLGYWDKGIHKFIPQY